MAWQAGELIADPSANQVLVSRQFTTSERIHVQIAVMSKLALDLIFQHLTADGTRVKSSIVIPVAAGFMATNKLGPITVDRNETIRIINRNSVAEVSGEEVQASLFFDP